MRELYVTLGHNASAVLAIDGKVVRGYEQERLDRKKSSSAFPKDAIERALGMKDSERFCDHVYVSHWFDEFGLESNKYLNYGYLASLSPHLVTLSPDFTHHDAHANSAVSFLSSRRPLRDAYVVVIDGFGNNQECLSVYEVNDGAPFPARFHRSHGYAISLGLMYQYVTEFLGMKPNKDEYKLLGYESHVAESASFDEVTKIHGMVHRQGVDHAYRMIMNHNSKRPKAVGTLIDYSALHVAKAMWFEQAEVWRKLWHEPAADESVTRARVAFCAQTFLEACVDELLSVLCPNRSKELILTGGVFLNVKLSRHVRMSRNGNVFVHPLCGDQGAAMGHSINLFTSGLGWGERVIGMIDTLPQNCFYTTRDRWAIRTIEELAMGKVVNVVREGGEYGPRALCNTTTFAVPTRENVALINALNERDEAMPMAPVMTRKSAYRWLDNDELDRSEVCDRYMVTTVEFKEKPIDEMMGVAHRHPLHASWTARPQIVGDDDPVAEVLAYTKHGCLINTSYNYHGEPIVQSEVDATRTHMAQLTRARQLDLPDPVTLLVRS